MGMKSGKPSLLKQLRERRRAYLAERKGLAVIEFVFILPAMMSLLVGSIEVVGYTWATGRVEDAAGAVGDLTAQNVSMNEQIMATIAEAGDTMIRTNSSADNSVDDLNITISSVLACDCGGGSGDFCFEVLWSHKFEAGAAATGHAQGSEIEVPSELALSENDTLIVTEVEFSYDPKIQFMVPDSLLHMEETSYFRPRLTKRIVHTGDQKYDVEPFCPEDDNG
ncbi:MAG: pilus assembly protein [Neomegalonema sp.]|nr:pilus assembly protein [Neomegalonema sp.]